GDKSTTPQPSPNRIQLFLSSRRRHTRFSRTGVQTCALPISGAAGGFVVMLGYPFCRGRIFQSLERDRGQYDDVREIFWATGACMFIKSAVFRQLKGFDEDYFAHQEEIDLCWRAQNAGHKVNYVGQSHVYHLGGSTLSNMNPKKTFLNFRNSLYTIAKNLPRRRALPLIFLRLVLDGIAGIWFLLQGKPDHLWA